MENQEQKKESKLSSYAKIIGLYICIILIVVLSLWLKNFKIDTNMLNMSIVIDILAMILIAIILLILDNNLPKFALPIQTYIIIKGLSIIIYALISFVFIAEIFNAANNIKICTFKPEANFNCVSSIMAILCSSAISISVFITTKNENQQKEKINKFKEEKKERREFIDKLSEHVALYITDICKYFYAQTLKNTNNAPEINREKAVEQYFILKIKLGENKLAKDFLFWVKRIHLYYCVYTTKEDELDKKNELYLEDFNTNEIVEQYKQLQKCREKILEEFIKFSKEYLRDEDIENEINNKQ